MLSQVVSSLLLIVAVRSLPMVDPGLFVISGVSTCGNGTGYCLLGADCSLNQDFVSDPGGHCKGLKGAFTPSAHFVCCTAGPYNDIQPTTTQGDKDTIVITLPSTTTEASENATETSHTQTITSPPEDIQVDTDHSGEDSENSIDWEGVKNLTEVTDNCPPCSPQTIFSLEGSPLCLGTHLQEGWVITSGSCALKVFRAGMVKVAGQFLQDPELETGVKTIAVHEDYRPYSNNILHPEPNNIGLILLSAEPRKVCTPCIPDQGQKFAGRLCATVANSTLLSMKITKRDTMVSDDVCEAVVETMQGEGTEDFYTLACDGSSDSRYNGEESSESGKGLLCRGYVAGIETGSGTGLTVFTRVTLYLDWIAANMVQEQRQTFETTF